MLKQYVDRRILDVIPSEVGPRHFSYRGGVVHSIRAPGTHSFVSEHHFFAVMLAPSPGITARLGSDKFQTYDAPLGMIVVNPANWDSQVRWQSTRENICVGIPTASMLDLAAQEFDLADVALQPPAFGTVDQRALRIAREMKAELQRPGGANELVVDSLVTLFGAHVLRTYGVSGRRTAGPRGGLTPAKAKLVRDFLHEHFSRKLSIRELAALTGLSPVHFIRAFKETFGMPPYRYLIEVRLAAAETFLIKGELAIAEIAYLAGFSNQSHLTATMKKYRYTTPARVGR
ncbi:helix-turn-helix domain-containing protein [Chelativorans xinjiangense]|uniref:helix-turn-helix domain-containing protein n=1 Tax=Chelativorans xinjiangense TaxID=2681485 RepID=UPI0013592C22|nr:AraC family transcriptional regulator [Chelativorans xinjiangense]